MPCHAHAMPICHAAGMSQFMSWPARSRHVLYMPPHAMPRHACHATACHHSPCRIACHTSAHKPPHAMPHHAPNKPPHMPLGMFDPTAPMASYPWLSHVASYFHLPLSQLSVGHRPAFQRQLLLHTDGRLACRCGSPCRAHLPIRWATPRRGSGCGGGCTSRGQRSSAVVCGRGMPCQVHWDHAWGGHHGAGGGGAAAVGVATCELTRHEHAPVFMSGHVSPHHRNGMREQLLAGRSRRAGGSQLRAQAVCDQLHSALCLA